VCWARCTSTVAHLQLHMHDCGEAVGSDSVNRVQREAVPVVGVGVRQYELSLRAARQSEQ